MSETLSYLIQSAAPPTQTTVLTTFTTVTSAINAAITPSGTTGAASSVATSSAPAASASAAAAAAAAAALQRTLANNFVFLFHINVLLLVLLGIFVIVTLPRTIALLSHAPARFRGFFLLSSGGSADAPPKSRLLQQNRSMSMGAGSMASEASMEGSEDMDTRTLAGNPFEDSESMLKDSPLVIGEPGTASAHGAPMRARGLLSLTHPAVYAAANYPILPGLPLRKFAVVMIYLGIWLYSGLYRYNPFTNVPLRAGVVSVAQIPIIVFCAVKNNPISWLTGVAYEKLNFIHRFAGRGAVIAGNIHAIAWFFSWNPQGPAKLQSEFSEPFVRWGVVCLVCLDLLFVGSLPIVRQRAYTLFIATHILGFFVLSFAIYLHYPGTLPYLITAYTVYGVDHLLRASRTRLTTAYITAHPDLNGGSTHVHLPGLTSGWRAGQHVRMRVVDPSLPPWLALPFGALISRVRARPFSASSAAGGDGLELLVKKVGRETGRMYALAGGEGSKGEKEIEEAREARQVKVFVEGPYSGPAALLEAHSGVLLVAGGSGVSYTLSVLDGLLAAHAAGTSRVRVVDLVWSITDPASLGALLPTIQHVLRTRPAPHGQLTLRIRAHYTRALRRPLPPHLHPSALPTGVSLHAGRPNLRRVLEEVCDGVSMRVDASGAGGVGITHCGPGGLGEEVRRAVGGLDYARWRAVRGVEVQGEVFGW